MDIKNSGYNIVFPRIENLRRKAFDIEDSLKDYFTNANIIPVPDNAPAEIPRIQSTSHNGHSNLNISLNNAQLVTNFDGDYNTNVNAALSYLEERVYTVANMLEKYTNGIFLFSGLTTEVIFKKEHPVEHMIDTFFKHSPTKGSSLHEVNLKTTQIVDDKYYANISISNERTYEGQVSGFEDVVSFADLELKQHSLKVTLDINDRHGFNTQKNYTSSISEVKRIFELNREILELKLENLIKEGVLDL
ncbi:hypothetical protein ACQKGI_19895 [Peribacillus muralis]|uniref:hypothetical protein n=1 Tax=Peribacillus muralis TaxID=264697 RepID=UPI003830BD26